MGVHGLATGWCADHRRSRFAFSDDDGASWTYAQEDAYDGRVAWAEGGSTKLWRRERPHMVVDQTGAPLAVSNGVQECLDTGSCPTANDRSWTLVQPIAQALAERQ